MAYNKSVMSVSNFISQGKNASEAPHHLSQILLTSHGNKAKSLNHIYFKNFSPLPILLRIQDSAMKAYWLMGTGARDVASNRRAGIKDQEILMGNDSTKK